MTIMWGGDSCPPQLILGLSFGRWFRFLKF
jgi:hypothetical protein